MKTTLLLCLLLCGLIGCSKRGPDGCYVTSPTETLLSDEDTRALHLNYNVTGGSLPARLITYKVRHYTGSNEQQQFLATIVERYIQVASDNGPYEFVFVDERSGAHVYSTARRVNSDIMGAKEVSY